MFYFYVYIEWQKSNQKYKKLSLENLESHAEQYFMDHL